MAGQVFRLAVVRNIFQSKGLVGFYSGLPAAALRHAIYSPARLAFYEVLRDAYVGEQARSNKLPDQKLVFTLGILGACAGVCGQVVRSRTIVSLESHLA